MNDRLTLFRSFVLKKDLSEIKKVFSDTEITEIMTHTEHSVLFLCIYADCKEDVVKHLVSLSKNIPIGIINNLKTLNNFPKYSYLFETNEKVGGRKKSNGKLQKAFPK